MCVPIKNSTHSFCVTSTSNWRNWIRICSREHVWHVSWWSLRLSVCPFSIRSCVPLFSVVVCSQHTFTWINKTKNNTTQNIAISSGAHVPPYHQPSSQFNTKFIETRARTRCFCKSGICARNDVHNTLAVCVSIKQREKESHACIEKEHISKIMYTAGAGARVRMKRFRAWIAWLDRWMDGTGWIDEQYAPPPQQVSILNTGQKHEPGAHPVRTDDDHDGDDVMLLDDARRCRRVGVERDFSFWHQFRACVLFRKTPVVLYMMGAVLRCNRALAMMWMCQSGAKVCARYVSYDDELMCVCVYVFACRRRRRLVNAMWRHTQKPFRSAKPEIKHAPCAYDLKSLYTPRMPMQNLSTTHRVVWCGNSSSCSHLPLPQGRQWVRVCVYETGWQLCSFPYVVCSFGV